MSIIELEEISEWVETISRMRPHISGGAVSRVVFSSFLKAFQERIIKLIATMSPSEIAQTIMAFSRCYHNHPFPIDQRNLILNAFALKSLESFEISENPEKISAKVIISLCCEFGKFSDVRSEAISQLCIEWRWKFLTRLNA